MGLRINTNVQALTAQRFLSNNHDAQNKSLERLSSGSRINRSGDDAAGLAISQKMNAHIRSLKQATRNASDGISLVQVAEGAMNETANILTRVRELSIQAASDTIGDVERGFINKEVQQLKAEVDRIAQATEYNGHKLLTGEEGTLEIQVGLHNSPVNDRLSFDAGVLTTTLDSLGMSAMSTATKEEARANLDTVDSAISKLNDNRSTLGALQNRLNSTITNNQIYTENLATAKSRIADTDMAEETSELVRNNILTSATVSVLSQANQNPQLALKLMG